MSKKKHTQYNIIKNIRITPSVCKAGETVKIHVGVENPLPIDWERFTLFCGEEYEESMRQTIRPMITIIGPDGIHEEQNLK